MSEYQFFSFLNISERNFLKAKVAVDTTAVTFTEEQWSALLPNVYNGCEIRTIDANGDVTAVGIPANTTLSAYSGLKPTNADPTATLSAKTTIEVPANTLVWISNTWDGNRYLRCSFPVRKIVATFTLDNNISFNAGSTYLISCNAPFFQERLIASIPRGTASNVLVMEYERGDPVPVNGWAKFTITEAFSNSTSEPSNTTNVGARIPSLSLSVQFRYYK